jgi:hypothetical protein
MGEYLYMLPKEAGVAPLAPQFKTKTSLFCLSDWEVQAELEQECPRHCHK